MSVCNFSLWWLTAAEAKYLVFLFICCVCPLNVKESMFNLNTYAMLKLKEAAFSMHFAGWGRARYGNRLDYVASSSSILGQWLFTVDEVETVDDVAANDVLYSILITIFHEICKISCPGPIQKAKRAKESYAINERPCILIGLFELYSIHFICFSFLLVGYLAYTRMYQLFASCSYLFTTTTKNKRNRSICKF